MVSNASYLNNILIIVYALTPFFQASPVSNSSYQTGYVAPKQEPVSRPPPTSSNGGVDFTKLSAKEMRELVASKKKKDPRKENTDFRRKYDEFNKL